MADADPRYQDIRQFISKSGRGYWICPANGEESKAIEKDILKIFRGRLIWNESRLCYVLPKPEGIKFWLQSHQDEKKIDENKIDHEKEGDLTLFPQHEKFAHLPVRHHALVGGDDPRIAELNRQIYILQQENSRYKKRHTRAAKVLQIEKKQKPSASRSQIRPHKPPTIRRSSRSSEPSEPIKRRRKDRRFEEAYGSDYESD